MDVSDDLCNSVLECLPILMDPPEPNDPEEANLAPLRRHLASCPACQAAANRRAGLAALTKNALEFHELEARIDAMASRGTESFLERIRADLAAQSKPGAELKSRIDAVDNVRSVGSRLVRLLRFSEFSTVPRIAMAAADRDESGDRAKEQFFQLQHPEHPVLAEVVASSAGLEVFVSTSEATLAEAVAEAELREHTGRSWNSVLHFLGGVAQWTVPVEAPFGGTYELALRIELPGAAEG